jgi:ElaB/YqjD/DUF883 family membrane-anchored ribosome-binding protein
MELYYKDFISEDASLENLVDNMMLLVQGADEFAEAAGAALPPEPQRELRTRLQRLKLRCEQLKQHAQASAKATDKLLRKYPYSSLGLAFASGLLTAVLISRRRSERNETHEVG